MRIFFTIKTDLEIIKTHGTVSSSEIGNNKMKPLTNDGHHSKRTSYNWNEPENAMVLVIAVIPEADITKRIITSFLQCYNCTFENGICSSKFASN